MGVNAWAVAAMALVGAFTFYLGFQSSRLANTTPDFLVARRAVRSRRNAAAVSGEYLSAASFLGVAGLVLKQGAGALWYPLGFTAGFLGVLLFVAAPLRRSGAYTLPDFAEARLGSTKLRSLCTVFVVVIGFLYLIPQLQGAGLVMSLVLPVPTWVGGVVVAVLVVANVLSGGMRATTVVQAFQYWVKMVAISVPTFALCAVFFAAGGDHQPQLGSPNAPFFPRDTTVTVKTPVKLTVTDPVRLSATGTIDGFRTNGGTYFAHGSYQVEEGTVLRFTKGTAVPAVADAEPTNAGWLRPDSGGIGDVLRSYSLIFALFVGTMGLPHVVVRFYTNPDGRAARRTTLHVLVLLGLFYLFPVILGGLSRMFVPQLLVTGQTDAAVLKLPSAMLSGTAGQILTAVLAAGAFAAFLSTCAGLLVSLAGVLSTDVLPGRVRDFRWATVLAGVVPVALAISLRPEDISMSVGMSFAMAASTFSPLLILGIWWRKLTAAGAAAGVVAGGLCVLGALVGTIVSTYTGGWAPSLMQQPALISVPLAFAVAILVSKASARSIPGEVNAIFLRLHAPDPLGFTRDRDVARFGGTDTKLRAVKGRHRK